MRSMSEIRPATVPSSARKQDGTWVDGPRDAKGKFNGLTTYWHDDGTIDATVEMRNDKWHGTFTGFDANGSVTQRATYADGVLAGPFQSIDGSKVTSGECVDGKWHGKWLTKRNDTLTMEVDYVMGTRVLQVEYGKDGQICRRQTWYANGNRQSDEDYENGKVTQSEHWDANGRSSLDAERKKARELEFAWLRDLPVLDGADKIAWAKLGSAFGKFNAKFPQLLFALTLRAHQGKAADIIAIECDHQETIYPISAQVMPFLVRLLSHPATNKRQLRALIDAIVASALPHTSKVAAARAVIAAAAKAPAGPKKPAAKKPAAKKSDGNKPAAKKPAAKKPAAKKSAAKKPAAKKPAAKKSAAKKATAKKSTASKPKAATAKRRG
jgi:antitoxin component YwqK of YwqJK toxin-antitoxin module